MSTRRVKNVGYDDDDLDYDDDYDEGFDEGQQEVSAEDKEQLRLGTIEVRKLLGLAYQVSDTDIQDKLWDSYYDIEKTVSYIKNKHKPKSTPAKSSQPTRKLNISFFLPPCPTNTSLPRRARSDPELRSDLPPISAQDFFADCPWGQVPDHRKADILVEPIYHSRGLLGGASKDGKMSKLAALAAKRRQKENVNPATPTKPDDAVPQDDYAASLSKLTLSNDKPKHRKQSTTDKECDASTTEDVAEGSKGDSQLSSNESKRNSEDEPIVERTNPSAFAGTFFHTTTSNHVSSIDTSILNKAPSMFDFKDPSPDDIVYKAQTGRAPAKSTSQPKNQPKAPSKPSVTNGVGNLNISDTPKVKSKNIDVLGEYKKVEHKNAANFVVIGHVDAGKSTLMGRLLFDLKAIDQRTMDRYKKEAENIGKGSFAFAWVLDQGSEERERGVTIDIAMNKFDTDKTSFTILDAPGHQDFVPNMIAGASQADFAVLVIDASPGNFESGLRGQTKEHALLAKSIGVQRLIVAVNKMDMVNWSQERFNDIKNQMSSFLKATRFNLESTAFIPCSGLQGDNILQPITDPAASWYKDGQTLAQALDAYEPVTHNLDRPLRMTVGDVFRGGVQNPISISGRIEAGSLQVGEQILVQPSSEKATIRALDLDNDDGEGIREWAVAGQNVVLHLTDIDPIHLRSGDVICAPGRDQIQNITKFTAQILSFAHLTPMNVDIHRGRLHVPGRISQLVGILDKKTGDVLKKKPKIVKLEEVVRVLVELERGVPIEAGGRVVLRAQGETVGAGLVE